MTKWRIGMLQIASELGQVEKNRKKVLDLTSKLQPEKLDLLCLPEMVLTGYAFPSADSIKPYLEQPHIGATSRCCSDLAKRLRCHVIAGYPESLSGDESCSTSGDAVGYNSAVIYGPDGEWHGGYRKTHLFKTDLTWAREGSGFGLFDLGDPLGHVSLGLCMDLNPQIAAWTSAEGPYELATFALDNNTRLLVILCAWLDSKEHMDEPWDINTVNYWLARLLPLWRRLGDQEVQQDTIVAICNRAGADGDVLFAGSSAIFKLSHEQDAPEIVALMRRNEEGVRVWEV